MIVMQRMLFVLRYTFVFINRMNCIGCSLENKENELEYITSLLAKLNHCCVISFTIQLPILKVRRV